MPGEPGEIVVKGDFLPSLYLKNPERSAAAFEYDPETGQRTYRTGFAAFVDHAGVLQPVGRLDELVKIRGYNVRPSEVEAAVQQHPGVREVAVRPFDGAKGIRRLACFYVPEPGSEPNPAELRAYIAGKVPSYFVPTLFHPIDALPRSHTGKVTRAQLPDPVALLAEIEKETGARIPFESLILDGATLQNLAGLLDQRKTEAGSSSRTVQLRQDANGDILFAPHVIGGHLSDYLGLAHSISGGYGLTGLHRFGLRDGEQTAATMQQIAKDAIDAIREQQPRGPYRIIGYSFGALIAYAMTEQLVSEGDTPAALILLDPPPVEVGIVRLAKTAYRPLKDRPDWGSNSTDHTKHSRGSGSKERAR